MLVLNLNSGPIIYTTTPVGTMGGRSTMTGTNFGTDPANLMPYVNYELCENVEMITNHTQLACDVVAGTGSGRSVAIYYTISQTWNIFYYEGIEQLPFFYILLYMKKSLVYFPFLLTFFFFSTRDTQHLKGSYPWWSFGH